MREREREGGRERERVRERDRERERERERERDAHLLEHTQTDSQLEGQRLCFPPRSLTPVLISGLQAVPAVNKISPWS